MNTEMKIACVKALAADDWKKADRQRLNEVVEFLNICEQPERWKLLEAVTGHLLVEETDLPARAALLNLRIEALAETGRAKDALALAEKSYAAFAKVPTQLVTLKLADRLIATNAKPIWFDTARKKFTSPIFQALSYQGKAWHGNENGLRL